LSHSPELAGAALAVRENEADVLQTRLLPNPEVEAEFEDFAGTGALSGTQSAETTVSVGQLIELGGKRGKRIRLAHLESQLSGWGYESKRIAVITDVARKFTAALAAQRKAELADVSLQLVEATRDIVEKRVRTGKVAPVELTKANVQASAALIRARRTERALVAAKHQLAAVWGSPSPRFSTVVGNLKHVAPLPECEQVLALLKGNPDLARWQTELSHRQAGLRLAKAQAVPDVTLKVGYRHFNESNDQAALMGVSIPLPFFDRNQGGTRKARYSLMRAAFEKEAAWTKLRAHLIEVYQGLASAHEEATALSTDVVPAAEQAFEAIQQSFKQGKAGYLDVLDAQRTLTDTREQHVDALASYHDALAQVEGLIAQPLPTVRSAESEKTR
jgi:cobalt-zinc-cadmium efflux system outer membrane protein